MGVGSITLRRLQSALGRRFALTWVAAFVTTVGAAAALIQLLPEVTIGYWLSGVLLGTPLVGAAVYAWRRSAPSQMSITEILANEEAEPGAVLVACTTERSHILEVNSLARCVYPDVKPLPPERYEQWVAVNPNILVCLFDRTRRIAGYFDVFPLAPSFMDMFVQGHCGEHDIRREHILRPKAARSVRRLYLGGIAVADRCPNTRPWHAVRLLWALREYVEYFYAPLQGKELYAEAVTKEGEALLRKFGFVQQSPDRDRRDPFALYVATLDDGLKRAQCLLPNWSEQVQLGWGPNLARPKLVRSRVA